uniref:ABC-2 type transporter transmembrane domain-containing protein n=3 Tax=Opuntia streptacantha TaxID=393608 RepID=A0A7C9AGD3_OPUST
MINYDFDEETEQDLPMKKSTEEIVSILKGSYELSESYQQVQAAISAICREDRGSLLMFVAIFLTFMTIGGFPSFVEDMKVFGRDRLNGHYGTTAFVISNTLSSMPYLFLVSLIPGAISYYLPGLQTGHPRVDIGCRIFPLTHRFAKNLLAIPIVSHFLSQICIPRIGPERVRKHDRCRRDP